MTSSTAGRPRFPSPLVLSSSFLLLAGCGSGSDDDDGFVVRTTSQAAEPSAAIVVDGDWMVYLASEVFTGPTGTNLNGDPDKTDQVAIAVNLRSTEETNLMVAARSAVILGDQIYLVVDEALDGVDWDGGGIGALVLLNWSAAVGGMPTLVDTLDQAFAAEKPVVANDRLVYSAAVTFAGADETNLRVLAGGPPGVPEIVENAAGGGNVRAHVIGEESGLVFCILDETDDALDKNGDGDALDQHVLAFLDATAALTDLQLFDVGLALESESAPIAAQSVAANRWLVAFLVDETSQGSTNLNDQTQFSQPLLPENCAGTPDTDALDTVLHWFDFCPTCMPATAPVSTGLAGHDRVLVLDGFVATISAEADANCNLNADTGDADMNDDVARWVATTTPVAPAREPDQLHALATGIGGGSMGLSVLDDRLIAAIDEDADSANLDGKAPDHELVAWLDPSVISAPWHFSHQASTTNCCEASPPSSCRTGTGVFDDTGCTSEPFAGTSWMAAEAVGQRLGLVFLEEVPGTNPDIDSLNTNVDCDVEAKDADKTDGLPVWADFGSGPTLDFDGVGFAVDLGNAGIEISGDFVFFRVSEAADNRDYNDDGQMNDVVLFRNPLLACNPLPMATSSLVPGQVITTDRERGAAFLSSESQAGVDFNDDGDTTDLVVRYFSF